MSKSRPEVTIARAYDSVGTQGEGYRVLVDRLWPRGIKKHELALDQWAKELSPSTELRQWFGHRDDRWVEFCTRYFHELQSQPEAIANLLAIVAKRPVVLIYGAKNQTHNNAVALRQYLLKRLAKLSR